MRRGSAAVASAAFFLVSPGVVAGVVPWLLTHWRREEPVAHWIPMRVVGAALICAGGLALLHSFARFVLEGRGTPAPVAPPDRLVAGGLYRHVRNPMYLAVVAAIVGQALVLGRLELLVYGGAVLALFAAFVHWYEEPRLARRFGLEYESYRAAVPAWRPRLRLERWTGDRETT